MEVDVLDHGAVGDGIADDTPAFRGAINEIKANGNQGIVVAPPGAIHRITDSLQFGDPGVNIDLIGGGRTQTKFVLDGYHARLRWGGTKPGTPPTFGAMGGETGHFTAEAGSVAPRCLMEVGGCSSRDFRSITLDGRRLPVAVGLAVNSTQNALFTHLRVDNCNHGVTLDYGAGGNTFLHPELEDNLYNVVFNNGKNGPKKTPSSNRFISGLIEGQFHRTLIHVLHKVGQHNRFQGVQFGGGPADQDILVHFSHNGSATYGNAEDPETVASHHLWLDNCEAVGGRTFVHHVAQQATVHVTGADLKTITNAYVMGSGARVDIDRYNAVDVENRFVPLDAGATEADCITSNARVRGFA